MQVYLEMGLEIITGLLLVLFFIRVMGRKNLQQLTLVDMLFVMIIADMFSGIAVDMDMNLGHLVFALVLWFTLMFILERITTKRKFQKLVEGEPKIVIKDGKINQELLEREHMTEAELKTMLREKGVFHLQEVEIAILEISGNLSVKKGRNSNGKEKGDESET